MSRGWRRAVRAGPGRGAVGRGGARRPGREGGAPGAGRAPPRRRRGPPRPDGRVAPPARSPGERREAKFATRRARADAAGSRGSEPPGAAAPGEPRPRDKQRTERALLPAALPPGRGPARSVPPVRGVTGRQRPPGLAVTCLVNALRRHTAAFPPTPSPAPRRTAAPFPRGARTLHATPARGRSAKPSLPAAPPNGGRDKRGTPQPDLKSNATPTAAARGSAFLRSAAAGPRAALAPFPAAHYLLPQLSGAAPPPAAIGPARGSPRAPSAPVSAARG